MWEADPGQFPCLRGGERVFLTVNTLVSYGETGEEAVSPLWVSHPLSC